ncbi:MAG: hypothetical protein ACI8QZ_000815 [Chlamydiales bacterium]|jgi:hypothetical protein
MSLHLILVLSLAASAAAPNRVPSIPTEAEGVTLAEARSKLRDLKRDLRDRHPEKRRRAVTKLALLDTRESWDLVVAALRDPDPQVGDEAQLKVTGWADPRGILLGKEGLGSRHEIVRLRVSESFGRRPERVDGSVLARRIDVRDARVTCMLLWSLERLARQGLLFEFDGSITRRVQMCLRKNLDPGLRAGALATLAELAPDLARVELEGLGADRAPQVRCAALAVSESLDTDGLLPACIGGLADAAPGVRSQALACIERNGSRAGVQALAQALGSEPRPRLRADIVAALQRLTGRKYRDDARAWGEFTGKLALDWEPAGAVEQESRAGETAAFAGLPILSDRVCFLVDFSGSLWHARADGRTPKDVLDRELRSALEALPPGTEFNVIPYTREPHPWREQLVVKRRNVVVDALRYFERCKETGPGSFFEAARLALDDDRVDAIVVLTDGAPTGGEHWNLELLFDLLVYENRFRRVAFDSVLVDASPRAQRSWAAFAERSHGRSIAVRMDADEPVLRPQAGGRRGS